LDEIQVKAYADMRLDLSFTAGKGYRLRGKIGAKGLAYLTELSSKLYLSGRDVAVHCCA